ncbi:MAG: hypothetical protein ACK41Z_06560 [Sediminibacterium sp.]
MRTGSFRLDFEEYDNNNKLFRILRSSEIFATISDRILIGHIYPDMISIDETIDDVVSILSMGDSSCLSIQLKTDYERNQFARFLFKTIPTLKNSGYQPYLNMPID